MSNKFFTHILSGGRSTRRMRLLESIGISLWRYTKYRIQRYTTEIETTASLCVSGMVKFKILLHSNAN